MSLSGPDGSGKTTLAMLLVPRLVSRGVSAARHWVRGSHLLASVLARFLGRFASFRGWDNPYYRVSIPRGLRGLWVHIEFWSFIVHYLVRVFLARLSLVVGDRGPLDFLVWVSATLGLPRFFAGVYGRFLLVLAQREFTVYVTASLRTLLERADVPPGFVVRELVFYRVFSRYVARCVVDTSSSTPIRSLAEVIACLRRWGFPWA